ncbi:MAG TPA: BON domain-containing protein [Pirellulales bacterium]|nr:BON domain-containing protein [Pirellulales bacterium]
MVSTSAKVSNHSNSADLDLERRVLSFLVGRHVPGLRNLQVEARNGTVTLRGRVHTFYEKQLCQSCCCRVAGVLQFVDNVDVAYSPAIAAVT